LYEKDENASRSFLTEFSKSAGDYTVTEWKKLYRHLFTKFMDGNIKEKIEGEMNPDYEQPGYGEEWYRKIIQESGDKFRELGQTSH
jgi:hypothetical protein